MLEKAKQLIRERETYSEYAYPDGGGWSVGWGTNSATKSIIKQGYRTNVNEAENWLHEEVVRIYNTYLKNLNLSENQITALCSFIYNVGGGNFLKSTLLQLLKKRDFDKAANEFDKWVYAGSKKLQGLVTRRSIEKEIFKKNSSMEQGKSKWVQWVLIIFGLVALVFGYMNRKAYGSQKWKKTTGYGAGAVSIVVALYMIYSEKIKALLAKLK